MIATSSASSATSQTLARHADQPRFIEAIVGRLLERMVYAVEGVRERLQRLSIH